jgi:hypothetical protein
VAKMENPAREMKTGSFGSLAPRFRPHWHFT